MKPVHAIFCSVFLIFSTHLIIGCAVNPVTGQSELHLITESGEIQMGEKEYGPTQQSQGGKYATMPELSIYVNEVGRKLAAVSDRPNLPYEFVVLNNPEPNAWALPGGKVALNRGLLEMLENEAELAAVLAHEIVHVAARHSAQNIERQTIGNLAAQVAVVGLAVSLDDTKNRDLILGAAHTAASVGTQIVYSRYGREAESEADRYGMQYMVAAGYDPKSAVTLQKKFLQLAQGNNRSWVEGLFASHPPSQKRVLDNRQILLELPKGGYVGKQQYQAKIAPLKKANKAYAIYDEGLAALGKGDTRGAINEARKAQTQLPRESLFYALEAKALYRQKKPRQALQIIDQAIQRNPDYFAYHLFKGQLLEEGGRLKAAEQAYLRSYRLLPTAEAMAPLGIMAMKAGDKLAASQYLTKAALFENTEAGKRANKALRELGMRSNPGRYVRTRVDIQLDRRIKVILQNNNMFALANIVLEISYPGIQPRRVTVPQTLAPGARDEVLTNIRMTRVELGRDHVNVRVVEARPALPGR